MRVRRVRAGLRGWGGVGAMAAVCALAVVFALLLPLLGSQGEGAAGTGVGGVARGTQVRAGTGACKDPAKQAHPENYTLSPSGADGDTISKIKARQGEDRKLVVGVDQNSYRWGYRNPNNGRSAELEGFDIDLVHRIAEDILGDAKAVRFKAIPTNQRIDAIKSGGVDMVVRTMTITCDRLDEVAFSAPYFKTGQQVLAPKSSTIKGYDATLAGKKICAASGSTAFSRLDDDRRAHKFNPDITVRTVPNQLDCLVRLQLGEVDAVVTDGALAASQAAQDPTVELKGPAFTTEYYGVAMKKSAGDLVRRVNQILADYRKDSTDGWQASYDRWLSATLDKNSSTSEPPTRPQYLG